MQSHPLLLSSKIQRNPAPDHQRTAACYLCIMCVFYHFSARDQHQHLPYASASASSILIDVAVAVSIRLPCVEFFLRTCLTPRVTPYSYSVRLSCGFWFQQWCVSCGGEGLSAHNSNSAQAAFASSTVPQAAWSSASRCTTKTSAVFVALQLAPTPTSMQAVKL